MCCYWRCGRISVNLNNGDAPGTHHLAGTPAQLQYTVCCGICLAQLFIRTGCECHLLANFVLMFAAQSKSPMSQPWWNVISPSFLWIQSYMNVFVQYRFDVVVMWNYNCSPSVWYFVHAIKSILCVYRGLRSLQIEHGSILNRSLSLSQCLSQHRPISLVPLACGSYVYWVHQANELARQHP